MTKEDLELDNISLQTRLDAANACIATLKRQLVEKKKIGIVKTNRIPFGQKVGDGDANGKPFQLYVGATTMSPMIYYNNKLYTLNWDEIVSLAEDAGLFEEAKNEQPATV